MEDFSWWEGREVRRSTNRHYEDLACAKLWNGQTGEVAERLNAAVC
jgi:hypothetical protein